jgi:uncharacterized protein (TIGR04255 family)
MLDWYNPATLPKFQHPPVHETAMGIEFVPLEALRAVALVELQHRWKREFPKVSEKPASPTQGDSGLPRFFTDAPPLRIWAEADDGLLVQSQADRLILNWRRVDSDAKYPGYSELRPRYDQLWDELTSYLREVGLPQPLPLSAEFTYVNEISSVSGDGASLTLLGPPNSELPGESVTRFQNIRTVAQNDVHPYPAQITITGEPQGESPEAPTLLTVSTKVLLPALEEGSIGSGLEAAHALSSHTFALVTSTAMHKDWERLQ